MRRAACRRGMESQRSRACCLERKDRFHGSDSSKVCCAFVLSVYLLAADRPKTSYVFDGAMILILIWLGTYYFVPCFLLGKSLRARRHGSPKWNPTKDQTVFRFVQTKHTQPYPRLRSRQSRAPHEVHFIDVHNAPSTTKQPVTPLRTRTIRKK